MNVEAFIFNDELELLEARLRETDGLVDRWVLVEAPVTFTGKPKPLHYDENRHLFEQWNDRIEHIVADLPVQEGAWACERAQRDAVHQFIDHLDARDTVCLCDGDELVSASFWQEINNHVEQGTHVLPMQQHYFTLCWSTPLGPPPDGGLMARSRVGWREHIGTAGEWADGQFGLQYHDAGWHLSCLGGPQRLCNKLLSFSHTELSDPSWANVENCARMIREGLDIAPARGWKLLKVKPQGSKWMLNEGIKKWPYLMTGGVDEP